MSIEKFFAENKPGSDFKAWIYSKIEQESRPLSPISMLAKQYREQGSLQIRTLSRIIGEGESSTLTVPSREIVSARLNHEQMVSGAKNTLAIIFGCAIPVIESTSREGWLDMSEFWGFYDLSRTGTSLPDYAHRQNGRDILTFQQWGVLDQAIRSNPDYALFLEERGINLLTPSLKSILQQSYLVYNHIIPQFRSGHISLARSLL